MLKFREFDVFKIYSFIFFYLTLIIGFYYNESLNSASHLDWVNSSEIIRDFSNNFYNTLLNYDDYKNRHTPVYHIFLSLFLDMGFSINEVRLINLHFCIFLILFFYKCLKLVFSDVQDNNLFFISLIIFLSPTFRSLAIWPDSRLPGLLVFVLTIYFFLKLKQTHQFNYSWYTNISLVLASYLSPNFSIFFPYFFFFFFRMFQLKKLIFLLIFNFFVSTPVLYYLFILDVQFLSAGVTPGANNEFISFSFNVSNKIMIISSIIFFHLSPILLMNNIFFHFKKFLFKKYKILIFIMMCLIYFFNYQISFTGGGVFFILSNMLLNNNLLFYIGSFIFLGFVAYIASLNLNNFFLITLIIISNIQNTIYHKYYEPMMLIIFLTLIKYPDIKSLLQKKTNIFYFYLMSLIYILMRIFKNILHPL